MPLLGTNRHLTTKPNNLDIKCQCSLESYDQYDFVGTKVYEGQIFFMVGGFFNKRKYSGAVWLNLLVGINTYTRRQNLL